MISFVWIGLWKYVCIDIDIIFRSSASFTPFIPYVGTYFAPGITLYAIGNLFPEYIYIYIICYRRTNSFEHVKNLCDKFSFSQLLIVNFTSYFSLYLLFSLSISPFGIYWYKFHSRVRTSRTCLPFYDRINFLRQTDDKKRERERKEQNLWKKKNSDPVDPIGVENNCLVKRVLYFLKVDPFITKALN